MWEPKTQGPSSIQKLWSVAGKVWRLLASSQSLPLALNISPVSALQLPWAPCSGVLSGTHPP